MKLATFIYSLIETRPDWLRYVRDYADIVFMPIHAAQDAIKILGQDKIYILACNEYDFKIDSLRESYPKTNFILQAPRDRDLAYFSSEPQMYREPAYTWEWMNKCKEDQIAAIIVENPLTFDCDNIKLFRNDYFGLLIASNMCLYNTSINSWFMRPEDIHSYEDVFDAILIAPAFLETFARGSYNGPLDLLFPPLGETNTTIENKLLPNDFAEHRLNCKQRCQLPHPTCHYCERILTISQQMHKLSEGEI